MDREAQAVGQTSSHALVDGHTHIDQYGPTELPQLLERSRDAGVALIIAAGTTIETCTAVRLLADIYPDVRAGIGLHPADLKGPMDDAIEAQLRTLADHPSVVEWSETGLDYMPRSPRWDIQQDAFRRQIRIARELGLPIVFHSREASDDTVRILREEGAGEVGGAWHYFDGSLELARTAMDLGFHISLAKPLLRLPELQTVAAALPLERLVIETDSYPQHFKKNRERWTEPWHLPQVAAKLAELQETDVATVAEATTANYLRMLGGRVSAEELGIATAS
ncbi:MAG: TatD family hydrolase [Chloroflexi bacterium]|nr:TatD family hydrolase [Chloroflexota bacterium]